MYDISEAKMAWYVPSEKGKELVEALLKKFLFPVVESLKNKNMDRDSLKKAFTILTYGFSGSVTCFDMPKSPVFKSPNSVLPWFKPDSINPAVLHWATEEHSDIYSYICTPISKKRQIFVLESHAYVAHMRIVVDLPDREFTNFHLRVLHILARLALNDYSEVRYEAQSVLTNLFSEYAIARELIVDDILPALTNPQSTREQLKGALSVISQNSWATSSTTVTKTKVWKAIIEMKVVDYPDVIEMYDDLWNDIGKLQKPARKHFDCPKLVKFCNTWWTALPKTRQWERFKDPKVLQAAKDERAARKVTSQKFINVVVYASKPQVNRTPLNECEKAIVTAFEDETMYKKWIELLLIEKNDSKDVNDNTVWMVKRAEQRLAAEIFTGVAKGTKYLGFKRLDQLWQWLAPAIDHLYDRMNADAYMAWTHCITDVLHRDDTRRFWWLIERLLTSMTRPAPTAWHQGIRSQILLATDWRETETRRRICAIAWKSLPKAVIETQRIGVSTSIKHVCTVLEANMNNDLKNLPERFHLEGVDVWLQRFEKKVDVLASPPKSTSDTTLKQSRSQDLSQSALAKDKEKASSPDKMTEPLIYLRTLLEFLLQYYEDCITCLTPGIMSLFPMLVEYANEDESDLLVNEKFAEPFLEVVIRTFHRSSLWRVRVSVLKFLQVLVFSNIYVLEMDQRPKKVVRLLFEAITDQQGKIKACSESKEHATLHGAVLGMGAVVMAHPYSTPPFVIPMLKSLCSFTSRSAELQKAATAALREFRRSHRDFWEKTTKTIGADLVYNIENAIAPIYYA
ncbi:unnamed protein product [Heligmosomoides polygyrus]|uniref:DUF3437 domain-containing protein n=1 Tax=Heligmosomoides polygyrus TaxID=6339 RepID=A0A3P8DZL5_HELPZ|nr:unnamed protein product [Heligmosomoides polygyrus]